MQTDLTDVTYVTSLKDAYDFLSLNSEIQKEFFINQFDSIKPKSSDHMIEIEESEKAQTFLEVENFLLKKRV